MRNLRILAVVIVTLAALLVWRITYGSQCASLAIPVLAIMVIGFQTAEYNILRRRCFADCMFNDGTFFHRMFYRRYVSIGLAFFVSVIAGMSLLLNLLTWSPPILALLVVDGLLLAFLTPTITAFGHNHLRPGVARIAAKNVIAVINAGLLLAALLAIQFYSPFPHFVDPASLSNTISQGFRSVGSECAASDFLAKLQVAKEGFSWWLMLKASSELPDPTFRVAAWIIFLLSGSLSVWAYSKLIVQVADLAAGPGETSDG